MKSPCELAEERQGAWRGRRPAGALQWWMGSRSAWRWAIAAQLHPAWLDYCVFRHCFGRSSAPRPADILRSRPLLDLEMCLGGGQRRRGRPPYPWCARPAARVTGMATFEAARQDKTPESPPMKTASRCFFDGRSSFFEARLPGSPLPSLRGGLAGLNRSLFSAVGRLAG